MQQLFNENTIIYNLQFFEPKFKTIKVEIRSRRTPSGNKPLKDQMFWTWYINESYHDKMGKWINTFETTVWDCEKQNFENMKSVWMQFNKENEGFCINKIFHQLWIPYFSKM